MNGKIHSIESMGTLDGPGLRTVVFMQGCMNKCTFCHNIDCALQKGGKDYSPEQLVQEVLKNRKYWNQYNPTESDDKIKGGVTFSGGDPMYQPEFLLDMCKILEEEKVHTTVDTSINADFKYIEELLPYVDLWMISVKHMDDEIHKPMVGDTNRVILENIIKMDERITEMKAETGYVSPNIRIRFLVIPSVTDDALHIQKVGEFIKQIKNLDCVELLAYSTIGRHKWIEIFGKYELEGIREATLEDLERTKKILSEYVDKFLFTQE